MKRHEAILIFMILIAFSLIISCKPAPTAEPLNPPEWIRGTWADDLMNPTLSYTFTSDNVVYAISGMSMDFRQTNEALVGTKYGYFDSTPDAKTYLIELRSSGITLQYLFEQINTTTLDYTAVGGTIQLYK